MNFFISLRHFDSFFAIFIRYISFLHEPADEPIGFIYGFNARHALSFTTIAAAELISFHFAPIFSISQLQLSRPVITSYAASEPPPLVSSLRWLLSLRLFFAGAPLAIFAFASHYHFRR
jgi:hypothetical protein